MTNVHVTLIYYIATLIYFPGISHLSDTKSKKKKKKE